MTAPARPNDELLPDVAARCSRDSLTGAATNAFGVKTAAAVAGAAPGNVATIVRSGRPDALIPAAVAPARNPPGIVARRSTAGRLLGSGPSTSDPAASAVAPVPLLPRVVTAVTARAGAARARPSPAGRGRG